MLKGNVGQLTAVLQGQETVQMQ